MKGKGNFQSLSSIPAISFWAAGSKEPPFLKKHYLFDPFRVFKKFVNGKSACHILNSKPGGIEERYLFLWCSSFFLANSNLPQRPVYELYWQLFFFKGTLISPLWGAWDQSSITSLECLSIFGLISCFPSASAPMAFMWVPGDTLCTSGSRADVVVGVFIGCEGSAEF